MIDWKKYFDRIYCIHHIKHTDRLQRLYAELERVNILNSGIFELFYDYDTPFHKILQKNIQYGSNDYIRQDKFYGGFKCTLSHYRIYKEADCRKYNRILILEDDVVFLKNIDKINEILYNIPDYNIILLDKFCYNGLQYYKYISNLSNKINDYFYIYNQDNICLGSAACYCVDNKGINELIKKQEIEFYPADNIFGITNNITKCFTIENIAIQRNYNNHESSFLDENAAYKFVNINLNNYSI